MIPVEQRDLTDEARGRVGDCWPCCIASILELPYEAVPNFFQMEQDGEIPSGWNAAMEFLRAERGLTLWRFSIWGDDSPRLVFGNERIDYHFLIPGYWIASVLSPRVREPCEPCDACGGLGWQPGRHAVVMRANDIVWDPHPQREQGHLGFVEAEVFTLAASW